MQNVDPVYFLQPAISLAISAGLVVFWLRRRGLTAWVLLAAAAAYSAAILVKVALQTATAGMVVNRFGYVSVPSGLYFGVQTSIFEVGIAYLVARLAVSKAKMTMRDGSGFGISLAFWENGVLLGVFSLLNLLALYLMIATGTLPERAYETLVASNPSLFLSPTRVLPTVILGSIERVSSLFLHFSWGYLCVLAACLRRSRYFLVALPMGLVDALVPFSRVIPLWEFETILFALAVVILLATLYGTKGYSAPSVETSASQSPSSREVEPGDGDHHLKSVGRKGGERDITRREDARSLASDSRPLAQSTREIRASHGRAPGGQLRNCVGGSGPGDCSAG